MIRLAWSFIMNIFHSLIIGFTLTGRLIGDIIAQIAQKFSHLFVYAIGLPVFPADFEKREQGGIMKREEIIAADMLRQESIFGLENPDVFFPSRLLRLRWMRGICGKKYIIIIIWILLFKFRLMRIFILTLIIVVLFLFFHWPLHSFTHFSYI